MNPSQQGGAIIQVFETPDFRQIFSIKVH